MDINNTLPIKPEVKNLPKLISLIKEDSSDNKLLTVTYYIFKQPFDWYSILSSEINFFNEFLISKLKNIKKNVKIEIEEYKIEEIVQNKKNAAKCLGLLIKSWFLNNKYVFKEGYIFDINVGRYDYYFVIKELSKIILLKPIALKINDVYGKGEYLLNDDMDKVNEIDAVNGIINPLDSSNFTQNAGKNNPEIELTASVKILFKELFNLKDSSIIKRYKIKVLCFQAQKDNKMRKSVLDLFVSLLDEDDTKTSWTLCKSMFKLLQLTEFDLKLPEIFSNEIKIRNILTIYSLQTFSEKKSQNIENFILKILFLIKKDSLYLQEVTLFYIYTLILRFKISKKIFYTLISLILDHNFSIRKGCLGLILEYVGRVSFENAGQLIELMEKRNFIEIIDLIPETYEIFGLRCLFNVLHFKEEVRKQGAKDYSYFIECFCDFGNLNNERFTSKNCENFKVKKINFYDSIEMKEKSENGEQNPQDVIDLAGINESVESKELLNNSISGLNNTMFNIDKNKISTSGKIYDSNKFIDEFINSDPIFSETKETISLVKNNEQVHLLNHSNGILLLINECYTRKKCCENCKNYIFNVKIDKFKDERDFDRLVLSYLECLISRNEFEIISPENIEKIIKFTDFNDSFLFKNLSLIILKNIFPLKIYKITFLSYFEAFCDYIFRNLKIRNNDVTILLNKNNKKYSTEMEIIVSKNLNIKEKKVSSIICLGDMERYKSNILGGLEDYGVDIKGDCGYYMRRSCFYLLNKNFIPDNICQKYFIRYLVDKNRGLRDEMSLIMEYLCKKYNLRKEFSVCGGEECNRIFYNEIFEKIILNPNVYFPVFKDFSVLTMKLESLKDFCSSYYKNYKNLIDIDVSVENAHFKSIFLSLSCLNRQLKNEFIIGIMSTFYNCDSMLFDYIEKECLSDCSQIFVEFVRKKLICEEKISREAFLCLVFIERFFNLFKNNKLLFKTVKNIFGNCKGENVTDLCKKIIMHYESGNEFQK